MAATILIVDDEPFNVDLLEQQLEEQGYRTCAARSGTQALAALERETPDLVLLDWMMPGMSGLEMLAKLRADPRWQALPVIMLTARDSVEDKVQGLDAGADDYVTKPIDETELWARIRAMLRIARLERENLDLRQQLESNALDDLLIGKSRAMEQVKALADKVIDSDTTVLITGASGTGKEILARTIHRQGPRAEAPFITVNCGALSEGVLESELFGHKKGSFTGAANDRIGHFESADGGTIFLDEIGETSPAMQVKLLRVLQEGEVVRVGESEARKISTRVIAATHRDLQTQIAEGKFREDLYYRLAIFPIPLPPLQERSEDVPLFALSFLKQRRGDGPRALSTRAMDALCAYPWPGNVRQLQNEIERAALMAADAERIDTEHLSEHITGPAASLVQAERSGPLKIVIAQVERDMIEQALKRHNGNRSRACLELGISRWGMVQKIKAYRIEA